MSQPPDAPKPEPKKSRGRGGPVALLLGAAVLAAVGFKVYELVVKTDRRATMVLGIEPVDAPAPEFVFEARDGKPVKLADLRGKYVFLNFWATWCPPCLEEMPSISGLARQLKGEPIEMIAATVDETWEPVDQLFAGKQTDLRILRDPNARWAGAFGTKKFPETYLIGPDGRLRGKVVGPRHWDEPAFAAWFREQLAALPRGK